MKLKHSNKAVISELQKYAKQMPNVYEEYENKVIKLGADYIKEILSSDLPADEKRLRLDGIDKSVKYTFSFTALRQVNHTRRILKAYKAGGTDAVKKYIDFCSRQLRYINEKYNLKNTSR